MLDFRSFYRFYPFLLHGGSTIIFILNIKASVMKNVIQSYFIYFLLGISFNFIRQILFIITLNIIIIFHIFVEKKKADYLNIYKIFLSHLCYKIF